MGNARKLVQLFGAPACFCSLATTREIPPHLHRVKSREAETGTTGENDVATGTSRWISI